jgi:hypothetical protein
LAYCIYFYWQAVEQLNNFKDCILAIILAINLGDMPKFSLFADDIEHSIESEEKH